MAKRHGKKKSTRRAKKGAPACTVPVRMQCVVRRGKSTRVKTLHPLGGKAKYETKKDPDTLDCSVTHGKSKMGSNLLPSEAFNIFKDLAPSHCKRS